MLLFYRWESLLAFDFICLPSCNCEADLCCICLYLLVVLQFNPTQYHTMATVHEQVVGHIQKYELPVVLPPPDPQAPLTFLQKVKQMSLVAGATRLGSAIQHICHSEECKSPAWFWHFAQSDAPLEIVEQKYSPGMGVGRREYHRPDCVPPAPAFHPASLGDTSFWNLKITKPGETYSFQNSWGKNFADKKIFSEHPNPPVDDWSDIYAGPIAHFRHFLQRRPLSRDIPLYMPIWDLILCDLRTNAYENARIHEEDDAAVRSAGHRAVIEEPVETFGSITQALDDLHESTEVNAANCADLLMWEKANQFDFEPAGRLPAEKRFWRIPFAHTCQQLEAISANPQGWKTGFHGTSLYALYAILYHGRLSPSLEVEGVEGDRGSYPAVYLFSTDYNRFHKVLTYAPWVCLEWKGVAFQCCLELKYCQALKENVSGDQVVCASENIVLSALWIRAGEKSDFVAGQDWVCMSLDGKLWDPIMEGNPLDAGSKIATRFNFRTLKFDTGTSAAVSSAAVSSAGKTPGGKRLIAPEAHDHEAQMKELSQLQPAHVSSLVTVFFQDMVPEFKERWDAWCLATLNLLFVLHDHQYENTVKALLTTSRDPVSILIACMKQTGDRFFAAELGSVLDNRLEPVKRVNDMRDGILAVISDSTLIFKRDSKKSGAKKVTPDSDIRWVLNKRTWATSEGGWPMIFDARAGFVLKQLCELAEQSLADVMNRRQDEWVGQSNKVHVRPRICVIVWAVNEGLDAQWRVNPYREDDPLWDSIKPLMIRLLTVFDRVGIICPGSAEIWGRAPELNLWIRRGIAEVRSAGVACFRCSRQMEKCEISVDGMHLSIDQRNKAAMADAVVSVYRYLSMTIPPRLNFVDERKDLLHPVKKKWHTAIDPNCRLKLTIDAEACLTQSQVVRPVAPAAVSSVGMVDSSAAVSSAGMVNSSTAVSSAGMGPENFLSCGHRKDDMHEWCQTCNAHFDLLEGSSAGMVYSSTAVLSAGMGPENFLSCGHRKDDMDAWCETCNAHLDFLQGKQVTKRPKDTKDPNTKVRSKVVTLLPKAEGATDVPVTCENSEEDYVYMPCDVNEWMDEQENELVINFLSIVDGTMTLMLKYVDAPAMRTYIMASNIFQAWLREYKKAGCYHVRNIKNDFAPALDFQIVAPVTLERQTQTKVRAGNEGTCMYCNKPKHLLDECEEFSKIKCWWCRSKEHDFYECPVYIAGHPGEDLSLERQQFEAMDKLKARVEYINWYTSQGKCFHCHTYQHTYHSCRQAGEHRMFADMPADGCFICGERNHVMVDCHWICHRVRTKRCYRCGNKGHTVETCFATACYLCQKFGHKQDSCPNVKYDDLPSWWAPGESSSSFVAVPSAEMTDSSAAVSTAGMVTPSAAVSSAGMVRSAPPASEDIDMSTEGTAPVDDVVILPESKNAIMSADVVDFAVDANPTTGVTSGLSSHSSVDARADLEGKRINSDGSVTIRQQGKILYQFANNDDYNKWLDTTMGSADVRYEQFKDSRTRSKIQEQPKVTAAVPAKAMPTRLPPPPPVPVNIDKGKGKGKNNVCDRCGARGHFVSTCVAKGCFLCGKMGHKQNSCPTINFNWPPTVTASESSSPSKAVRPISPVVSNVADSSVADSSAAVSSVGMVDNMQVETTGSLTSPEPVAATCASEDVLMSTEENPPDASDNVATSLGQVQKWRKVGHQQYSKGEGLETLPKEGEFAHDKSHEGSETVVYAPADIADQPMVAEQTQLETAQDNLSMPVAEQQPGTIAKVSNASLIPCRHCGKSGHYFRECPENPQLPKKRRVEQPTLVAVDPKQTVLAIESATGVQAATLSVVVPSTGFAETVNKTVNETLQPNASSDVKFEETKRARVSETQPASTPMTTMVASSSSSSAVCDPTVQMQVSVQAAVASPSGFGGSSSSSSHPAAVLKDQTAPSMELAENLPGGATVAGPMTAQAPIYMTPEEAAPIKEKFASDSRICLDRTVNMFLNDHDWRQSRFESLRIARWTSIYDENGGHLGVESELQALGSGDSRSPSIQLINLVVSVLQGRVEEHDEDVGEVKQTVHINRYGWARIDHALELIKNLWPVDIQLETVIDCILHDSARRLEVYMSHVAAVSSAGHADNYLPTHVRAVHGHHVTLNVRARALFGNWQKFEYTNIDDAPQYVYHYTTPDALSWIARANEICPGGLNNDRNVECVYFSPLPATADFNLPGCTRKQSQTLCMVLDFHLMLCDGFSAFYAADGTICVVGPVQSGYVLHVFDLQYGEHWFCRNFEINYPHRRSAVNTVDGRRQERQLNTFPCIVCGGLNWMGIHVCFHCTRPHFYQLQLPQARECNPRWRHASIIEPSPEFLSVFRNALHDGRRLKGQIAYAVFNLKPPSPEVEKKRLDKIRGNPGTMASSFDKSQDRLLLSLNKKMKFGYTDVWDRINKYAPYRISLANHLIHVDCYPNPAEYLLSQYCTYALRIARELEEVPQITPLEPVQLHRYTDV